jgi:hypothetical protein
LVLPFIEQQEIYENYYARRNGTDPLDSCNEPDAYARRFLPEFTCPSNQGYQGDDISIPNIEALARGNYVACFGAGNLNDSWTNLDLQGAYGVNTRVDFGDVTDGTSSTLAISEVKSSLQKTDSRGVWALYAMGSSSFSSGRAPNSPVDDLVPRCTDTKVGPCGANTEDGTQIAAARSHHPGGVVVSMVDGSTRFVSRTVNLTVWNAMGTKASGEVIPD